MSDVDLIPRSYRERVRLTRTLTVYARAYLAVGACIVLAAVGLRWYVAHQKPALDLMRVASNRADSLKTGLDQLRLQKARLDQAFGAAAALRSSSDIERIARSVEAALPSGVWFNELRFSRSIDLLDAPGVPASEASALRVRAGAGQVVVLPADANAKPPRPESRWLVEKTMQVRGGALDLGVLTEFMKTLSNQPGVAELRFLLSSQRSYGPLATVEFSLMVSARPGPAADRPPDQPKDGPKP